MGHAHLGSRSHYNGYWGLSTCPPRANGERSRQGRRALAAAGRATEDASAAIFAA